jgi:hypothetical protein
LTFPLAVTILNESITGDQDMDPRDTSNEELELDNEIDPAEDYEYEDDGDWMDADALASAGWGTDEDYGYYGGDEW